jgi:hypothetical protein
MTRPLASYLEPWIADGDPLPDTVTVNAADLLAAVGELRRMREALEGLLGVATEYMENTGKDPGDFFAVTEARAALAPADGG